MKSHTEGIWFHPQKIEVEECMNIGPQEKTVLGMLITYSAIGRDMCSLQ